MEADRTIELLPQRPPMVLIHDGVDIADGEAEAYADCSENCLFFDAELDGVPGCAALEYMAQTMAFAVGANRNRKELPPKIGFVLGSRHFMVKIPVFRRGERYRIVVKCNYTDGEFAAFDCRILTERGEEVAKATLNAYQASDGKIMI